MPRCPGQDMRYWTAKDIFEVMCFNCGSKIEFWKDEPTRICSGCGREVRNPRIDLGCAKWCKYAKECIGKAAAEGAEPVAPVIDRLELLLEGYLAGEAEAIRRAKRCLERCEKFIQAYKVEPCVIQSAAMAAGALMGDSVISRTKVDGVKKLLERAGLEENVAGRICEIVYVVLSGMDGGDDESNVLSDIVGIERIRNKQEYKFKTEVGAKLASQVM